ncbi:glucose 1-dehydrogenase [Caulobacter segnis]|uniref:SDR family NAD(P)-dependent oxidoreductase n=1 Tax=Caulobacter segnis TaxID=88688 RepID=UPI00285FFEDE|nr:glucose 1-dehydrogenase [Caulobacter segnis]MDR6626740.1 NAD(P)-dependent dehydrogenase (short-subunit alcohol dehydrogenase family) [Caulobacter segnis]
MVGRLDGKIAVITGGCSGIGLGTVELFAAEGALVVAADLQDEKGAMLEKRFPDRVRYIRCDVTSEADVAAALGLADSAFGGLDILFNNAGHGGTPAGVGDMTVEGWDKTFALLVRGPAIGMKHAVPLMAKRGGGSIINTASIAGLQAGFGPLAYSTGKAAVIHLSRCAAAELASKKIRVNAICPGLIATSIFGASMGLPREVADQMAAQVAQIGPKIQPIPKSGLPEDIARAALYLASDDSEFVTGTHIVVDGGITVGPRSAWDVNTPSPILAAMGITPEQAEQMRAALIASGGAG